MASRSDVFGQSPPTHRRQPPSEVVCYQLYKEKRTLPGQGIAGLGRLDMEWQIPDDPVLRTQLSTRPARYWELEATGETPGVDYQSRFRLPVYPRIS